MPHSRFTLCPSISVSYTLLRFEHREHFCTIRQHFPACMNKNVHQLPRFQDTFHTSTRHFSQPETYWHSASHDVLPTHRAIPNRRVGPALSGQRRLPPETHRGPPAAICLIALTYRPPAFREPRSHRQHRSAPAPWKCTVVDGPRSLPAVDGMTISVYISVPAGTCALFGCLKW